MLPPPQMPHGLAHAKHFLEWGISFWSGSALYQQLGCYASPEEDLHDKSAFQALLSKLGLEWNLLKGSEHVYTEMHSGVNRFVACNPYIGSVAEI